MFIILSVFSQLGFGLSTQTLIRTKQESKHEFINYSKILLPISNTSLRLLNKLKYIKRIDFIILNIFPIIPIIICILLLNKRERIEYEFISKKYVIIILIISILLLIYNIIIYFTNRLIFSLKDSCYGHTIIWICFLFEVLIFYSLYLSDGLIGNVNKSYEYCCLSGNECDYIKSNSNKCDSKNDFTDSCRNSISSYYTICFIFLVIFFIPYVFLFILLYDNRKFIYIFV